MKKRLICCLILLLSFACAPAPDAIELPPSAAPIAEESTVQAAPTGAGPAVSAPTDAPTAAPNETAQAVEINFASYVNDVPSSPLLCDMTVKEINWELLHAGKLYDTKFWNEQVDFQGFRFSVESCRSDGTGTEFVIRVRFPEAWTDLQCLSMNQYIGFRFCLDGKAKHDFFLSDQSVILGDAARKTRCDSFTMTYTSEEVTADVMQSGYEWEIVPYFYYWKKFAGNNYTNKDGRIYIDVEHGDVCRYNGTEDAYWSGEIGVTELTELTLRLPVAHTHEASVPAPEPKLIQIPVWTEDVERNEAAGHYGDDGRLKDGSYVLCGTWQNVTVDCSELEFRIERFYYWEHGFFYILHIVYPESWPEEVRRNARFWIDVLADGEPFGERIDDKGHVIRGFFKGTDNWRNTGNPKNDAPYPTETYIVHDQKNFSLSNPIVQKELTFKVSVETHPYLQDNSGRQIDITDGSPYYIDRDDLAAPTVIIPLTEFSIATDKFTFSHGGAE